MWLHTYVRIPDKIEVCYSMQVNKNKIIMYSVYVRTTNIQHTFYYFLLFFLFLLTSGYLVLQYCVKPVVYLCYEVEIHTSSMCID